MVRRKKLSDRQKAILDFIRSYLEETKFPPTIREIGSAVGISSTSVVNYNLKRLEERGYLVRERDVSRGLRLAADAPDLVPVGGFVRIPMAGPIAAGEPIPIPDVGIPHETIEVARDQLKNPAGIYALEVKGDSMIDALVNDGDIVLMRRQESAENGEMVAVWLKDREETTLKRFYQEGKRVRLQPANPTLKPILQPAEKVEIQGKVVMVIRHLSD